jgi:hypothetical protein
MGIVALRIIPCPHFNQLSVEKALYPVAKCMLLCLKDWPILGGLPWGELSGGGAAWRLKCSVSHNWPITAQHQRHQKFHAIAQNFPLSTLEVENSSDLVFKVMTRRNSRFLHVASTFHGFERNFIILDISVRVTCLADARSRSDHIGVARLEQIV